jgi:hypothetical protein
MQYYSFDLLKSFFNPEQVRNKLNYSTINSTNYLLPDSHWEVTLLGATKPIFESVFIFEQFVEETHFRGFSVGYETGEFRYNALVELIFDALLDFVLPENEKQSLSQFNARRKMRNAA